MYAQMRAPMMNPLPIRPPMMHPPSQMHMTGKGGYSKGGYSKGGKGAGKGKRGSGKGNRNNQGSPTNKGKGNGTGVMYKSSFLEDPWAPMMVPGTDAALHSVVKPQAVLALTDPTPATQSHAPPKPPAEIEDLSWEQIGKMMEPTYTPKPDTTQEGMEDFEAPVPAWVDHDHEPPPAASPASSQGSTPLGFVMSLPTPKASNAGGVFGKLNLPPPKNASPAL